MSSSDTIERLPSAKVQGESLGSTLIAQLHTAITDCTQSTDSEALAVLYEDEATLEMNCTRATGAWLIIRALESAGLLNSRWEIHNAHVVYIPGSISATLAGTVTRTDGTSSRFMQALEYRCKGRVWRVHYERLILNKQCVHPESSGEQPRTVPDESVQSEYPDRVAMSEEV